MKNFTLIFIIFLIGAFYATASSEVYYQTKSNSDTMKIIVGDSIKIVKFEDIDFSGDSYQFVSGDSLFNHMNHSYQIVTSDSFLNGIGKFKNFHFGFDDDLFKEFDVLELKLNEVISDSLEKELEALDIQLQSLDTILSDSINLWVDNLQNTIILGEDGDNILFGDGDSTFIFNNLNGENTIWIEQLGDKIEVMIDQNLRPRLDSLDSLDSRLETMTIYVNDDLQGHFDKLDTQLEKIYIEGVDDNPYATGETLSWGYGWNLGVRALPDYQSEIEVGYNWGSKKRNLWHRRYPHGQKGFRLGISAGIHQFMNEPIIDADKDKIYEASGYGPFFKFNMGTPVLLNFISGSGYLKAAYILGEGDNDNILADEEWGLGIGSNLEIWYSKNLALSLGFSSEGTWGSIIGDDDDEKSLIPLKIRPAFGVKFNF